MQFRMDALRERCVQQFQIGADAELIGTLAPPVLPGNSEDLVQSLAGEPDERASAGNPVREN